MQRGDDMHASYDWFDGILFKSQRIVRFHEDRSYSHARSNNMIPKEII